MTGHNVLGAKKWLASVKQYWSITLVIPLCFLVQVLVRVKPANGPAALVADAGSLRMQHSEKTYTVDQVLGQQSSQADVFQGGFGSLSVSLLDLCCSGASLHMHRHQHCRHRWLQHICCTAAVGLPLVRHLIDGRYNSTCAAYGMTGSGKTHSMQGSLDPGSEQVNLRL